MQTRKRNCTWCDGRADRLKGHSKGFTAYHCRKCGQWFTTRRGSQNARKRKSGNRFDAL